MRMYRSIMVLAAALVVPACAEQEAVDTSGQAQQAPSALRLPWKVDCLAPGADATHLFGGPEAKEETTRLLKWPFATLSAVALDLSPTSLAATNAWTNGAPPDSTYDVRIKGLSSYSKRTTSLTEWSKAGASYSENKAQQLVFNVGDVRLTLDLANVAFVPGEKGVEHAAKVDATLEIGNTSYKDFQCTIAMMHR